MKEYIVIIVLQFSVHLSFGQLKKSVPPDFVMVGEAGNNVSFVARLGYSVTGSDTTYTLFYNNNEFTRIDDIKSFSFKNQGGALDSLYSILKRLAEGPKGAKEQFNLGSYGVVATAVKVPGFKGVNVTDKSSGSYFGLNVKQINQLFGKESK